MNCPKCDTELARKFYKGAFEVDSCPACRGLWLDAGELDRLEDMAFDEDEHKGSLVHFQVRTEFPCPVCGEAMDEFQYRLYDLKLDTCTSKGHGYWLDAGEEERVIELMRRRADGIHRQPDSESAWKSLIKQIHTLLGGDQR